jgi:hypothetical protein
VVRHGLPERVSGAFRTRSADASSRPVVIETS